MFFVLLLVVLVQTQAYVLKTGFGSLEGNERIWEDGRKLYSFKKVPLAKPPLGKLRFALAEFPDSWDGIWNATDYGPACPQNSESSDTTYRPPWVDEDCLQVNIFTSEKCLKSKDCPIVPYIHGGGFAFDSMVMFNDEYLYRNFAANDVVLFLPAFRLGFLGLLALSNDHVVPRNLAVYDYIHSLNWIQREGRNFGGNTNDVTLFGHSMGANLVTFFMFSKTIDPEKKLFQKGIAMSPAIEFIADEELFFKKHLEYVENANCRPKYDPKLKSDKGMEEAVECLRNLPLTELLKSQSIVEKDGVLTGCLMLSPLFPAESFKDFSRNPPARPFMIGSIKTEFDNMWNLEHLPSISQQLELKHVKQVAEKFQYDMDHEKFKGNHSLFSQHMFVMNEVFANSMKDAGADVYLYSYENYRHSHHTDDLSYFMGIHTFDMDENEKVLSILYPKLFFNFIKTGVPNHDWKPLQDDLDNYYYIDVDIDTGSMPHNAIGYQKEYVNYWTKEMVLFDKMLTKVEKTKMKHDLPMEENALEEQPTEIFSIWNIVFLIFTTCLMYVLVRACRGDLPYVLNEKSPLNV